MERWKKIEGFEIYEVSNKGNVRSKSRVVKNPVATFKVEGKMLKGIPNSNGYLRVNLYKDGKYHRKFIHRLVAQHFIENAENKPCVNHIDNNPQNNDVENLEWCTHQENMDWANKQGRMNWNFPRRKVQEEAQAKYYIAVIGENIVTGEKMYFSKLNDVKKAGFQPSCVCYCCKGKRGITQHKGYRWKYEKVV